MKPPSNVMPRFQPPAIVGCEGLAARQHYPPEAPTLPNGVAENAASTGWFPTSATIS